MSTSILVYGAGGHGRVVAEAAEAAGLHVAALLSDEPQASRIAHWPVLKPGDADTSLPVIVAIGDNASRHHITRELAAAGRRFVSVIHPGAWVSPSSQVADGVYVGPHAAINANAIIHNFAVINTGAIVEHDCIVGVCAHVAPSATLGGAAHVGDLSFIATGAVVLPGVKIGKSCVIAAGAVVLHDVSDGQTVMGVPAKSKVPLRGDR